DGTAAPSVPNSTCARSTASHSRRSATTLASGDQIATISSLAYRLASTLGIVTDTQLTAEGWRPGSGTVGPCTLLGLTLRGAKRSRRASLWWLPTGGSCTSAPRRT